MEECMICFEEQQPHQFIYFSCTHKSCVPCFVKLMNFRQQCPICEYPITIYIPKATLISESFQSSASLQTIELSESVETVETVQIIDRVQPYECCKVFGCIFVCSLIIFYLVNYNVTFKN
jgi:hypothetical protein